MDNNYKWYNDDFQNQSSTSNTYESRSDFSSSKKPKKKIKINLFKNKKKTATVALSLVLAGVISVSGYSLISGKNDESSLSASLSENFSSQDEIRSDSESNAKKLINSTEKKVYTTPEIVDMVGPAVVGVVN